MKKHLYILLFTLFGFLIMPSHTLACNIKNEKTCCKKEIASKNLKDCCKKQNQNNKNTSGCNGKCGHLNCTNTLISYGIFAPFVIELKQIFFPIFLKKEKFYDFKTAISSGFKTIWLPPVIA